MTEVAEPLVEDEKVENMHVIELVNSRRLVGEVILPVIDLIAQKPERTTRLSKAAYIREVKDRFTILSMSTCFEIVKGAIELGYLKHDPETREGIMLIPGVVTTHHLHGIIKYTNDEGVYKEQPETAILYGYEKRTAKFVALMHLTEKVDNTTFEGQVTTKENGKEIASMFVTVTSSIY